MTKWPLQALFGENAAEDVSFINQFTYDFRPEAYAPSRDYDGRFGEHRFRKHFYSRMGDFDSKEEYECAVQLDIQAQKGRLQFWVRNLARREGASASNRPQSDRLLAQRCRQPNAA